LREVLLKTNGKAPMMNNKEKKDACNYGGTEKKTADWPGKLMPT